MKEQKVHTHSELNEQGVQIQSISKNDLSNTENLSPENLRVHHFSWHKEEIKDKKYKGLKFLMQLRQKQWKCIQIYKEMKRLENETLKLEKKNARILKIINIENKKKNENFKPNGSTKNKQFQKLLKPLKTFLLEIML